MEKHPNVDRVGVEQRTAAGRLEASTLDPGSEGTQSGDDADAGGPDVVEWHQLAFELGWAVLEVRST